MVGKDYVPAIDTVQNCRPSKPWLPFYLVAGPVTEMDGYVVRLV